MLSADSASVIQATLPAVSGALDDIAARFYASVFAEHLELPDGLFHHGDQTGGIQRQALAGSMAAFATALIADPEARPDTVLARITHEHTALGVTDDQYLMVHKYLFGAISEVLGDTVTPQVAGAWDEVYWLMAGALIAEECRLYLQAQVRPGHPWREWTVIERREETADTVSFLLHPADGQPAPPAHAGQYVSVRVRMPDGVHQLRQYSLSSVPGDELRRITVKRVHGLGRPDGGVSTLLHRTVHAGGRLTLSAPFGDVTLDASDAPLVLISAGIGCAPMVGILEHLAATASRRSVLLLHVDRSPADHALRHDTHRLVRELPDVRAHYWYEDTAGSPSARTHPIDLGPLDLPTDAQVYLCGPLAFMRSVREQVLHAGIAARNVRYEVFGPDLWLADTTA